MIGFDQDTVDTYYRTLEFCEQTNVIPLILTLIPMPGSKVFEEFIAQGRMLPDLEWGRYGGGVVLFRHPVMTAEQMLKAKPGCF